MTVEQREAKLDLVEGLVARGYDRPAQVARNLNISRATATRWLKIVVNRSTAREGGRARDERRAVALSQAHETLRSSWKSHAEATACGNVNGAVGALRTALEAQRRIAALTGLDSINVAISQGDLDDATDKLLASQPHLNAAPDRPISDHPMRALRGLP